MKLGIPVYDGVDLLDVAGPYEMFKWAQKHKDLETVVISEDGRPVTTHNGLTFDAQGDFESTPDLDVIWVPGGSPPALSRIMTDENSPYLNYVRQISENAKWVCSVCEGALLAARAGVLDGHIVTTHWAFIDCLKAFPNVTVHDGLPRFVVSGNRLTGGGISSGLDESLKLISLLYDDETAEQVQKSTQYFPDPPVDAKLPSEVPACPVTW